MVRRYDLGDSKKGEKSYDAGTVEFSSEIAYVTLKFTAEHMENAKAQENRK